VWKSWTKRTPTGPAYEPRLFLTTDARQQAFDDDCVITTAQSGLAGLVPLWQMIAAELPNGFDYMVNTIGLGGTQYPVSTQEPLVDQPQFLGTFLAEYTGMSSF
jgi:hypothetical protein